MDAGALLRLYHSIARVRPVTGTRSSILLYPWLPTWRAFNLDTVLSIWLTGLATYGWLRRHVGPAGALTGAAIFGLSGFVWAHLIHTSMTNALISVPLAVWALEAAWDGGRLRPLALGSTRHRLSGLRRSSPGHDPHGGPDWPVWASSRGHRSQPGETELRAILDSLS